MIYLILFWGIIGALGIGGLSFFIGIFFYKDWTNTDPYLICVWYAFLWLIFFNNCHNNFNFRNNVFN